MVEEKLMETIALLPGQSIEMANGDLGDDRSSRTAIKSLRSLEV